MTFSHLLLSSFLLHVVVKSAFTQNLVPNPSFEYHTACPTQTLGYTPAYLGVLIPPWYSPTKGSPDYFNACDTNTSIGDWVGVPLNCIAYQPAHTGSAYVGLVMYVQPGYDPNYWEYIQVPLAQPMDTSKYYCISFYVSLADRYNAIDNIGMWLSTWPYKKLSDSSTIKFVPQIENPNGNFLADTLNWMIISKVYKPDSAYSYITIGNFYDDANTDFKYPYLGATSYYYLDDVSVVEYNTQQIKIDTLYYVCKKQNILLALEEPTNYPQIQWYNNNRLLGTGDSLLIFPDSSMTIKVSGLSGCYQETKLLKIIVSNPQVHLGNDTSICIQDSLFLTSPFYNSYQWSTGATSQNIYINNPGTYWVKVTDSIGCSNADTIQLLSKIPIPSVSLGNDTSYCSQIDFQLKAGGKSFKYKWQNGSTDTVFNVTTSGKYWVVASTRCGQASDTITVDKLSINAPNIITPNGDGYNDQFKIERTQKGIGELLIYSSWGSEVYKNNNYNDEWSASELSDGIYYYYFSYQTCESVKGWIEVIR